MSTDYTWLTKYKKATEIEVRDFNLSIGTQETEAGERYLQRQNKDKTRINTISITDNSSMLLYSALWICMWIKLHKQGFCGTCYAIPVT